jgi:phage recombination protein Bet
MTEALAVLDRQGRAIAPVVITDEQVDLIKRTIAADATPAELQLFFYDCRRRGVHPLDKLIHFTKRKGKYTPVTSIDFFRARAAETKEHMGTEDAIFSGTPKAEDFAATVTVFRMVQGEKCPFTATARWTEYCPEAGNDFMWKKMPHGQLAKCSEALALRKGFPQELENLHTFEEMDRAHSEEWAPEDASKPAAIQPPQRKGTPAPSLPVVDAVRSVPDGAVLVTETSFKNGKTNGRDWKLYLIKFSDGREGGTLEPDIAELAERSRKEKLAVMPTIEPGKRAGTFKLLELAIAADKPMAAEKPPVVEATPEDLA